MNDFWWVLPPAMIAVVSVVLRRNLTIRFGWPLYLQAVLILVSAIIAVVGGDSAWWPALPWILFIVFLLVPSLIIGRCERYSSLLQPDELLRATRWIGLLYWGELGTFWRDIYSSYAFYMMGEADKGSKLLGYWEGQRLPVYLAEQVSASRLVSEALTRNWAKILDRFEAKVREQAKISPTLGIQAGRAYAEQGNLLLAEECLRAANLAQYRVNFRTFCIIYLAFFALTGVEPYTRNVIGSVLGSAPGMPTILLRCWWARCLAVQRRYDEAESLLRDR